MKKNGQKIHIIDEIGDFKSLYNCLLEPASNERLRQLVIQCQLMSGSCIIDVLFNEWLMGRGANPVTWCTLISKLRCAGMIVLADTIEQEMEEKYPSHTIYLEKVQTCSRLISKDEHIQGVFCNNCNTIFILGIFFVCLKIARCVNYILICVQKAS